MKKAIEYVEKTVLYKNYKRKYNNYETVQGSYNTNKKTITILVPEIEAHSISNSRGVQPYKFSNSQPVLTFNFIIKTNRNQLLFAQFDAKTIENATKNVKKYCKIYDMNLIESVDSNINKLPLAHNCVSNLGTKKERYVILTDYINSVVHAAFNLSKYITVDYLYNHLGDLLEAITYEELDSEITTRISKAIDILVVKLKELQALAISETIIS